MYVCCSDSVTHVYAMNSSSHLVTDNCFSVAANGGTVCVGEIPNDLVKANCVPPGGFSTFLLQFPCMLS